MALYSLKSDSLSDFFFRCEFLRLSKGLKFVQQFVELNLAIRRPQIHNSIPLSSYDVTAGLAAGDDIVMRRKKLLLCAQMIKVIMREIEQIPLPIKLDL